MIHRAVAGALFDPRGQISRSVKDEPLAALLAVYLLAGFSWVLSDFLIHGKTRAPFSLVMDAVVYMALLALLLCLGTILLHFFAGILGGRTDHNALFWGVAQSAAPLMLLVPLALAAQSLGTMSGTVYLPGKLGVFLWIFACQVVAISEACRISVARAIFVFFLGYGCGILAFLALSLLLPLAVVAKISLISG